ncbi:MAG: type 1 glutamine amidotransferase [Clostridiales bacterium]|nr:type 1 glutamine amidotransferase [Clostridiales bacterium]
MRKPRIGASMQPKGGDVNNLVLNDTYRDAIAMAGGEVVELPYSLRGRELERVAATLDGVLFSGGCDIAPWRYGHEVEPACGTIQEARDQSELAIWACAEARGLPVLGICRGVQLINVAMGGTLIQDIPSRIGDRHMPPEGQEIWHVVDVEPGTRLRVLARADRLATNSYHHQSILDAAPGLRITARSPKGIVEAVEGTGKRYIMGLQWHPEMTRCRDEVSMRFFHDFLAHC